MFSINAKNTHTNQNESSNIRNPAFMHAGVLPNHFDKSKRYIANLSTIGKIACDESEKKIARKGIKPGKRKGMGMRKKRWDGEKSAKRGGIQYDTLPPHEYFFRELGGSSVLPMFVYSLFVVVVCCPGEYSLGFFVPTVFSRLRRYVS